MQIIANRDRGAGQFARLFRERQEEETKGENEMYRATRT